MFKFLLLWSPSPIPHSDQLCVQLSLAHSAIQWSHFVTHCGRTFCYTLWENILLHTEEGSCVTKVKCNQKFGKIYRECFRAIGNPEYPNNRQLTSDGLTHSMANPMDTRFTISLLVKNPDLTAPVGGGGLDSGREFLCQSCFSC